MPRAKATTPPTPEPSPSRVVITHRPAEWYGRLRQELVAAGLPHDRASLVARRVLSSLIPTPHKLVLADQHLDHAPDK